MISLILCFIILGMLDESQQSLIWLAIYARTCVYLMFYQ